MEEIKEADPRHAHWYVCHLKAGRHRKHGVKFRTDAGYPFCKRASGAHARRRGDFRDHRVAGLVLEDDVVISIVLLHVQGECRVHDPDGSLDRRHSGVLGEARRRYETTHGLDGRRSHGPEIHELGIRIGPCLDGPSRPLALRRGRSDCIDDLNKGQGGSTRDVRAHMRYLLGRGWQACPCEHGEARDAN